MTAYKNQAGTVSALGSFVISILQSYQIHHLESMAYFIVPTGIIIAISTIFSRQYLR